jgi:carbonic anhydrase-like protein
MKKVFYFDSPREWYQADAAIVWCFDNRFELGFRKFLKRIGIINSDAIRVGGGAKSLASPEQESDREFVLEEIRKSIQLHATRRVILMSHSDCGAYGRLDGGFSGDAHAEAQHHERELRKAAAVIAERLPGIEVQSYFVDFEGIWEVEGVPSQDTSA